MALESRLAWLAAFATLPPPPPRLAGWLAGGLARPKNTKNTWCLNMVAFFMDVLVLPFYIPGPIACDLLRKDANKFHTLLHPKMHALW